MDSDNENVQRKGAFDDSGIMCVENDSSIASIANDPDRGNDAAAQPVLPVNKEAKKSATPAPAAAVPCIGDSGAVEEQFLSLAKSAKGAAAVQLVKEALEAPLLYVFAELLHMPNIKELSTSAEYSGYYRLMEVFAYGIYDDYVQNQSSLPTLSPAMLTKLRHLTIVTLANKQKTLPLDSLKNKLALSTRRELEDLIIEAIYADVLHGKLDQKNGVLEVEYALGRDIKPEDLPLISSTLKAWCNSCTGLLDTLEGLANRANKEKEASIRRSQNIDQEVNKIKMSCKRQINTGVERGDDGISQTVTTIGDLERKVQRAKRGIDISGSSSASTSKPSGKFWPKS